jgi:hypothetical protein
MPIIFAAVRQKDKGRKNKAAIDYKKKRAELHSARFFL